GVKLDHLEISVQTIDGNIGTWKIVALKKLKHCLTRKFDIERSDISKDHGHEVELPQGGHGIDRSRVIGMRRRFAFRNTSLRFQLLETRDAPKRIDFLQNALFIHFYFLWSQIGHQMVMFIADD